MVPHRLKFYFSHHGVVEKLASHFLGMKETRGSNPRDSTSPSNSIILVDGLRSDPPRFSYIVLVQLGSELVPEGQPLRRTVVDALPTLNIGLMREKCSWPHATLPT